MNELLALGLAFLSGAVFGYATRLWRDIGAEEKQAEALNVGTRTLTNVPLPPPGATQTRIYGPSGTSFFVAHDCIKERCRTAHGGVR